MMINGICLFKVFFESPTLMRMMILKGFYSCQGNAHRAILRRDLQITRLKTIIQPELNKQQAPCPALATLLIVGRSSTRMKGCCARRKGKFFVSGLCQQVLPPGLGKMPVGHLASGQHLTDSSVSEFGAGDYFSVKVTIFMETVFQLKSDLTTIPESF